MSPIAAVCHGRRLGARAAIVLLLGASAGSASAQGVLDDWASIRPPEDKPVAHRVALDPAATALLVLDLATQTCSNRPRCLAMLPRVQTLIDHARERHWTVAYTIGAASRPADILPTVAKRADEALFTGPPDKFIGTGLEALLKERGIKTVVAVGSAAEGAVLETAASAAFRGFNVVVPVDGMASTLLYNEQYVAWDLTHAPRVSERTTLSAIGLIE